MNRRESIFAMFLGMCGLRTKLLEKKKCLQFHDECKLSPEELESFKQTWRVVTVTPNTSWCGVPVVYENLDADGLPVMYGPDGTRLTQQEVLHKLEESCKKVLQDLHMRVTSVKARLHQMGFMHTSIHLGRGTK